ncbi:MAG: DUF99 family protein [Candidatus Diapherotrites archaeon]
MNLKKFIRVIAFDDGYFEPRKSRHSTLVGVVYRNDARIEGIVSTHITVDGLDATQKLIRLVSESKFLPQVSFILLSGINFAGFNVADAQKLFKKFSKPVIVVFRKKPRMKKIEAALSRLPDSEKRLELIKKAGPIHEFRQMHFQCIGCETQAAKLVIKKLLLHSNLPEPVRLAHLIASGVTLGESTPP